MSTVTHYDRLAAKEGNIEDRNFSPISYQLKMNNWIKNALLKICAQILKRDGVNFFKVLELGIGRGGDLSKLKFLNVERVIGLDISKNSLEEALRRYKSKEEKFDLILFYGDFTTQTLETYILNEVHLVSCQFSMHYAFATGETALCFFRTVIKALLPGCYFCATFPNAIEIIKRLEETSKRYFGNKYFCVTFDKLWFGRYSAKYRFRLDNAVNADEYLVHPTTLKKFFFLINRILLLVLL
jgi:mRNA (guanine-N7-)-methyltransferase